MKQQNLHLFRRGAAGLAAAVLLGGAAPVTAFAEGQPVQAALNKTVTKRETTLAPRAEFAFAVAPGQADAANNILAGPAEGAVMGESVHFAPAAGDIGKTELQAATAITLDPARFAAPGVYRYTVTEQPGRYDGITYDTKALELLVYVVNDAGGGLAVGGYTLSDAQGEKSDTFTNDYGAQNGSVNDLTITKTVTGNMGDRSKEFSFTLQVTPAEEGEEYYLVVGGEAGQTQQVGTQPVTFTLKNGESAVLHGLSPEDVYTLTETDYSAEGYTTTVDGEAAREKTGSIRQDTTVAVVNERAVSINTGIVQDTAPWLLLAGGAAGVMGMVVYSRRKRRE